MAARLDQLTPSERVQDMLALVHAGVSRNEVARVFGISRAAVRDAIRRWNAMPPPLAPRPCLSCGRNFRPAARFNRVCASCKNSEDWRCSVETYQVVA